MDFNQNLVTLIITSVFLTSCEAGSETVVYGQVGTEVTLPHSKWGGHKVNTFWYFGSDSSMINNEVYSETYSGAPRTDPSRSGRVSLAPSEKSLRIKNLGEKDFGFYRCLLREDSNSIETIYRLSRVTVISLNLTSPFTLIASQSLSLQCVYDLTSVSVSVQWVGPQNNQLQQDGRLSLHTHNNSLTLRELTANDTGKWHCRLKYDDRQTLASVQVTVIDFSSAYPSTIFSFPGARSLLLPCLLSPSPPLPLSSLRRAGLLAIKWTFTPLSLSLSPSPLLSLETGEMWGNSLNPRYISSSLPHNLSITIDRIQEGDAGNYTCSLFFKDGTVLQRTVELNVLRVVLSPNATLFEGQPFNLTCDLGRPLTPDLQLTWTYRHFLQGLVSVKGGVVSRKEGATEQEKGRWKCSIKKGNAVLTSVEFTLRIERAPVKVWLLVLVCSGVFLFLSLLLLLICVLRRCRQNHAFRRTKKRKTRYCRCKHPQPKTFYGP
ncbi:SN protein, partial [Amia calva]|nr:SN protein [Amia calva]